MISGLFKNLDQRISGIFRCALAELFGGLLLLGGVGFLAAALWRVLAAPLGETWAAVILGGTLMLLGVIVLAVAGARNKARPVVARAEDVTVSALVEAFIVGMTAGKATQAAPPKDPQD